jgi:phytoene synthase
MRILPASQRDAMLAIYAFCRAVDDIADDVVAPRFVRKAALDRWRVEIDALYDGRAPSHLHWLLAPLQDYNLAREDFQAIIDGMQMDIDHDIRAPDPSVLDLYCDRVASAVGRLSVRVFGLPSDAGERLAHHLGRALQLTNILRDLDEDAAIGRLYLPDEALQNAGITTTDPLKVMAHPNLPLACQPVIAWARHYYREARLVMSRSPRSLVRCPSMMADVYEAVLTRLETRGFAAPRKRVRTPKLKVLTAFIRHGFM